MPVRKEYTPEFKDQAVRFVLEEIEADESRKHACERLAPKLSVKAVTLYSWLKQSAPAKHRAAVSPGSVEEPVAVWGFTLSGHDGDVLLKMHATMGPAMSPPRASAAKDPENAETIISKRLHQWSKNMTATVEGIKSLSEQ